MNEQICIQKLSQSLSESAKVLTIRVEGWRDALHSFNNDCKLQVPALIVKCATSTDISQCIKYAHENNLQITPRSGCHNLGNFSLISGGIVVDVRPMKQISHSVENSTVTYGSGCTFQDVDTYLRKNAPGYTIVSAMDKKIGVVGTRTSVGVGYLQRSLGNGIDNLLQVKVVLASGQLVTASENQNSELFHCIKGAGANFGIVVQLTQKIHNIIDPKQGKEVNFSLVTYDLKHAQSVMKIIYEFYEKRTLPQTILITPILTNLGDKKVLIIHYVEYKYVKQKQLIDLQPSQAQVALRKCQKQFNGEGLSPYQGMQNGWGYISNETLLSEAMEWNSSLYPCGGFVSDEKGWEIIQGLISSWKQQNVPLCAKQSSNFFFCGGNVQRSRDIEKFSVPTNKHTSFIAVTWGSWTKQEDKETVISWVKNQWAPLKSKLQFGYLNAASFDNRSKLHAEHIYGPLLEKLQIAKSKYDPENFFKHNVNIPPKKA